MTRPASRRSPYFFSREPDGSARFRLRLPADLAAQIEEAAGSTELMVYIQRVLRERSAYHIKKRAQVEGVRAPLDVPDPEDL